MKIPIYDFELEERENTQRFYKEIFEGKIYALENVLDLGGNRGLFAYYISPFARHVFTVEPHTPSFEVINKHCTEDPRLKEIVKPFHAAISKNTGMVKLGLNQSDGGYHVNNGDPLYEEVQAYTLNDFMKLNNLDHVDLMKIDVEDSERDIFQAEDIDQALSKISLITGEGHCWDVMGPVLARNGFISTSHPGGFWSHK